MDDPSLLDLKKSIHQLLQEKGGEKVRNSRGEDRISLLPESLLYHLLSFLPTEKTVCTSVLSSTWRNLWKWVPSLDVNSLYFPKQEACVGFMNKFLNFQSKFYLREFKLVTVVNVSLYEPCLGRVIKRRIQHFEVDNWLGLGDLKIPLNQSVCENLVCLKLHCARLTDIDESLSLPCLKIMYLEDVELPENVVVIDTPRLEYLSLKYHKFKRFFKIISMSDSVKVDINVDIELDLDDDLSQRNIIYNLLSDFSAVGVMTMAQNTLELIYYFEDMNPLPKFRDLTRLRATIDLNVSLELLPIVLESCPNLKHLTLELVDAGYPEATKLPTVLSFCLVSSLESVEMESLITKRLTVKKLVRYFLDNATSLKKLVLRLKLSHGEKQDPHHFKTLFDSPRRSSVCQFEVITLVQTAKV